MIGVPSLPAVVDALAEGRYDVVHVTAPGPAGAMAAVLARIMEVPVVASFHTELSVYAGMRTGDARVEAAAAMALMLLAAGCCRPGRPAGRPVLSRPC